MQLITCRLPASSEACPTEYVAQLWQERWPTSTEDYELEMYARVRAVCGDANEFATFRAPAEVRLAAAQQTASIRTLLEACKEAM